MAWWTKSTKRQRGTVKAHEAKQSGRRARRQLDKAMIRHAEEWAAGRYRHRGEDDE